MANLITDNNAGHAISGTGQDDVILANGGQDVVLAGEGDDSVFGGNGRDLLLGDAGNDVLSGDAGNDTLNGGIGDDLLQGGRGNDKLTGGTGADIFDYQGNNVGDDTILDFETALDKIDLRGSVGSNGSRIHIEYNDDGATIRMDGIVGSIFVKGVHQGDLVIGQNILPSCFLRGTTIRTTDGEVAVEDLAIGDLVLNKDGEARPVRWIGRRAYNGRFAGKANKVHPVLIRAGALGEALPASDLRVSGDHAMVVGGAFVKAEDLVNGATIVRDTTLETIEYFHVELASHDVILANGAETESYVNHDTRRQFSNWQEYVDLYGDEGLVAKDETGEYARLMRCVSDEAELACIRSLLPPVARAA
jgi:hypothetical protein